MVTIKEIKGGLMPKNIVTVGDDDIYDYQSVENAINSESKDNNSDTVQIVISPKSDGSGYEPSSPLTIDETQNLIGLSNPKIKSTNIDTDNEFTLDISGLNTMVSGIEFVDGRITISGDLNTIHGCHITGNVVYDTFDSNDNPLHEFEIDGAFNKVYGNYIHGSIDTTQRAHNTIPSQLSSENQTVSGVELIIDYGTTFSVDDTSSITVMAETNITDSDSLSIESGDDSIVEVIKPSDEEPYLEAKSTGSTTIQASYDNWEDSVDVDVE